MHMSEQTTPSLLEQLQAHHQAGYLSLQMPGHKENAALAPYLAQLGARSGPFLPRFAFLPPLSPALFSNVITLG